MITYAYDEIGRLTEKVFPNGMQTTYVYDAKGKLIEMVHRDHEGVLDKYTYAYDLMGNKTTIEKQRRGLIEESGTYMYTYDALSRLKTVYKDGVELRSYEYDAFGNRKSLVEEDGVTTYTYNAANQLLSKVKNTSVTGLIREESFIYDKRGNLSLVMENGVVKNSYTYGASNCLEVAARENGQVSTYQYDGLGHRVGKTIEIVAVASRANPDLKKHIHYTIDMTKGYHNLLQTEENGITAQTYIWDKNVVAVISHIDSEQTNQDRCAYTPETYYYLQDELGSPIRLKNKNGSLTETYGYDEFGKNLYGNRRDIQTFGYTGYQTDAVTGTYFAQAREYRPEEGRFCGRDIIKGNIMAPCTLNEYGYCWNNPMVLVDKDGKLPQWIEDTGVAIWNWWKTNVYGVDVVIQQENSNCMKYEVVEHYGGNIIVEKKDGINFVGDNMELLPTIGLSFNASMDIPKTNSSLRQSFSVESLDPRTWKYSYTVRSGIEDTNIYAETGWTLNKDGINQKIRMGGNSDTAPLELPSGINTGIDSYISWSVTSETNIINPEELLALVSSVVFLTVGIAATIVIVVDDVSILGTLNDSLLIPVFSMMQRCGNTIYEVLTKIVNFKMTCG